MMYKEDIEKVDAWFEEHTEYYGTSHNENEYTVSSYDIGAFTHFLRDEFPDLVYIQCYIGTGDENIWFFKDDLEKATFL